MDARCAIRMKLAASMVGSLKADLKAEMRQIEKAATGRIKEAGHGLKGSLRRQVISAGLGKRLARAWRNRAYPNKGYDAANLVWSKALEIVWSFDRGMVIKSKFGFWLVIPKRGVGGKRMTPATFPGIGLDRYGLSSGEGGLHC